jgi:hypothetical protein
MGYLGQQESTDYTLPVEVFHSTTPIVIQPGGVPTIEAEIPRQLPGEPRPGDPEFVGPVADTSSSGFYFLSGIRYRRRFRIL